MAQNPELFASMATHVEEAKLVEEIESLCMNCHEDVCVLIIT
jgi:hypothetical protein